MEPSDGSISGNETPPNKRIPVPPQVQMVQTEPSSKEPEDVGHQNAFRHLQQFQ